MELIARDKCFSCGACISICPQNAIVAEYEEGFPYPKIDQRMCIDCGQCKSICPADKKAKSTTIPKLYAFQHNDASVITASSSGGAFSAISDSVLSKGGLISGAVIDRDLTVRHIIADSTSERNAMRGAKYVQSDMKALFSIGEDMVSKKNLLFTGTPCQTNAFKNYCLAIGLDLDNIILCSLVCHGASSPKVWRQYVVEYIDKHEEFDEINVNFRCKESGWRNNRMKALIDGREIEMGLYSSLYFSNLCTRRSCFSCPYSTPYRDCDITLGDFWTIQHFDPDFEEGNGVSMILTHSEKGDQVIQECRKYGVLLPLSYDPQRDILQPALAKPYSKPKEYERFWKDFGCRPFSDTVRKYVGHSFSDRVRRRLRRTFMK